MIGSEFVVVEGVGVAALFAVVVVVAAGKARQAYRHREARRLGQPEKNQDAVQQWLSQRQREVQDRAHWAQDTDAEKRRAAEQEQEAEKLRAEAQRQRESAQQPEASPRAWRDVLGVSSQESAEEIRRSYAAKLKQYHPDRVNGMAPELVALAELKTKELNAAFAEAKQALREG